MDSLVSLAYLTSAVCFIMALRGLASPETARQGNMFGVVGMALAVVTTLSLSLVSASSLWFIALAVAIGGSIGAVVARKIKMTALPQLVAAFHSLVGLAAVLVAGAAFTNPSAYGIGSEGNIHFSSLIEMGLGVAIGAITFSGSIVAFAKLQGLVTGKPLVFPFQHQVNLGLGVLTLILVVALLLTQSPIVFLGDCRDNVLAWFPAYSADWWRRHAGCYFNAQQLLRLGSGGDRVYSENPLLIITVLLLARQVLSSVTSCAKA